MARPSPVYLSGADDGTHRSPLARLSGGGWPLESIRGQAPSLERVQTGDSANGRFQISLQSEKSGLLYVRKGRAPDAQVEARSSKSYLTD